MKLHKAAIANKSNNKMKTGNSFSKAHWLSQEPLDLYQASVYSFYAFFMLNPIMAMKIRM